jgi:imidazolonepropionase-like amidohydrolase
MRHALSIRLASLLLVLAATAAHAGEQHAFFAARIWPGSGEPIDDAVMIVEDGKVTAIGPRKVTNVPAGAQRHDLSDSVLIPGLVIAETSLGVATDDQRTLTPEVRGVDGFDFYEDYTPYLAGGVTTVQVSPGRARLMPGQGGVVKLAGASPSDRILSEQESLRIILTNASANPPRIYQPPVGAVSVDNPLKPTRPQISGSLSSRVAGLNAVFGVARESGEGGDELGLETISEYVSKAGTLRAKVNLASEVRAAMGLAQRYDMKLILVDPTALDSFVATHEPEGSPVSGIVLNAGVSPGAITNPAIPDPERKRQKDMWEYAAKLSDRGFGKHLAIRPSVDTDLDDMLFLGGLFTRSGNSPQHVLSMLTTNPARMMGVDSRVGALSAGHDADFVVLNADPFSKGSTVMSTWVNGKSAYDRKRENQMTLVQASSIYMGDGQVLENASIVVGGKKIRGIGSDVSAPPDARMKRFRDGVIVPGYIDLSTGLGLGGAPSSMSLSTRVGDRLVADDPSVEFARKGGVTTAVLATSGSPSSLLAFKLGPTPRVLKEPVGIRFTMSTNLTTGIPALKSQLTRGKAYTDSWDKYDKDLAEYKVKLKEYEAAKARYDAAKKVADAKKAAEDKKKADAAKKSEAKPGEKKDEKKEKETAAQEKKEAKPAEKKAEPEKTETKKTETKKPAAAKEDPNAPKKPKEPKKPSTSASSEPYRAAFAGKIPVLVEANTKKTIEAAVKLFREEFKLNMILVGGNELYRVPELLASNDVSVSLGPTLIQRADNKTYNLPQILANHGVSFGFQSKATTGVRQLPLAVQYSVHKGLGKTDALSGFTAAPSKLLALHDQVGSLSVGKDADLVVLSGPPFEISSEVLAVMIDGEWVYEKEME